MTGEKAENTQSRKDPTMSQITTTAPGAGAPEEDACPPWCTGKHDRPACNGRRFPGLAAMLGEACADGAR